MKNTIRRAERRPLKQVLWYFGIDGVRAEDAAFLGATLIAHCYRETALPETRRYLLQAVAESPSRRPDTERALLLFGSLLRRVFGLNASGMADAVSTFEAWRLEQRRRLSLSRI
jgi:hypothetical protein